MATELILVRHGHAVRVNGHYYNAPLTTKGQEQAALTGKSFCERQEELDWLFCSPLRRARETAGRIALEIGKQPHILHGVQEIERFEVPQLIAFELMARAGIFGRYLYENIGKPIRWPISGRVSQALFSVLQKHEGERIVVVMHAGVINGALAWFFPRRRRRWYTHNNNNCSLTRIRIEDGVPTLVAYDNTDHLFPEIKTKQPPAQSVVAAEAAEKAVAPPPPPRAPVHPPRR